MCQEEKIVKNDRKPVICFDFKTKNRIRVHRVTMHLLGDPDYIQILVNPLSKTIAIRRGNSSDPLSIRLKKNMTNKDCYELFSKELMNSLKLVSSKLKNGKSYRIYGEMDSKKEVAQFKISDMKIYEEA